MSDARELIDKAAEFMTSAVKAGSRESHESKVNIAQTAALISIALSLHRIAEAVDDD